MGALQLVYESLMFIFGNLDGFDVRDLNRGRVLSNVQRRLAKGDNELIVFIPLTYPSSPEDDLVFSLSSKLLNNRSTNTCIINVDIKFKGEPPHLLTYDRHRQQ